MNADWNDKHKKDNPCAIIKTITKIYEKIVEKFKSETKIISGNSSNKTIQ